MMFWMVSTCPDGALYKIWLKSVTFKGIKNSLKDDDISRVLLELIMIMIFLTGAGDLDGVMDGLHMP